MTACLLGRGELNKLKLSYFPSLFFGQNFGLQLRGLAQVYLCPHARDVWGSSEELQLDAESVGALRPSSTRPSAKRSGCTPKPSRAPSRGTAGHPRFASHLKQELFSPGFDKGMFELSFASLWCTGSCLLVRWIRCSFTGSDGLWLAQQRSNQLLRS